MTRSHWLSLFTIAALAGVSSPAAVSAQDATSLAGKWTLNRELSQFPQEIGFGSDWASRARSMPDSQSSGGAGGGGGGGGRGRRGGGGGGGAGAGGAFPISRVSQDDSRRTQQLTDEVRTPSAHLTIVESPTAVTITNDAGVSRTFHPTGGDEVVQLDGVSVDVSARREAGRFIVDYRVDQSRVLRYTLSRVAAANPAQLAVDVQFLERGGGDTVHRVYQPTTEAESRAPVTQTRALDQPINQQPDAELKGLTKIGVVVEGLTKQSDTCGLKQDAIESAVAKRLSGAGFTVPRNTDEDTYLYVNVMTATVSNGLCVSRYDVSLDTHTAAKLSYQQTPVLVQVSLLHKGGLAGGAPSTHAADVLRGVQEYIDQFTTRIRDANK